MPTPTMREKKCKDCLAHYTGEHTCPPWMKALVKSKEMTNPLLTTFREKFCRKISDKSLAYQRGLEQYPKHWFLRDGITHKEMEDFILYAEQKGYERALVECEEALPKLNMNNFSVKQVLEKCREAIRSKGKK